MREKIYEEIRRLSMGQNHVWRFQQYNPFRLNLNPIEQREFSTVMNELCEEGIFTVEKDDSVVLFRLTEKGEKLIYS